MVSMSKACRNCRFWKECETTSDKEYPPESHPAGECRHPTRGLSNRVLGAGRCNLWRNIRPGDQDLSGLLKAIDAPWEALYREIQDRYHSMMDKWVTVMYIEREMKVKVRMDLAPQIRFAGVRSRVQYTVTREYDVWMMHCRDGVTIPHVREIVWRDVQEALEGFTALIIEKDKKRVYER